LSPVARGEVEGNWTHAILMNGAVLCADPERAMKPMLEPDRRSLARLKRVDEHIALENQHDLPGILATFGATARYDDAPWDAHYVGLDGVRAYYEGLLEAIPDLRIEVQRRYVSDEAVIVEVMITGHHLGLWRGLPATGRPVRLPLCGIFVFDDDDRLAGETIYYDRATVLRQLGVFHEPDGALGRIGTVIMHPVTIARAIWRMGVAQRTQR
jgi:steroid delta-isomerase-like uncharacterized protein